MTGPSSSHPTTTDDAPMPPEMAGAVDEVVTSLPPAKSRGQLREFLATLGGFAPPKPQQQPGDEPPPARSRRGLLITCFVLTLGAWLYQSWSSRPVAEMPSSLLGAWVTSAPSYADRGFWIGKRQVAFRVGANPGDVNVYPVTRIKVRSVQGDTTTFAIEYAVDGGTNQWSFRYSSSPRPAIAFVHQPEMTWTPIPDQSPPIR